MDHFTDLFHAYWWLIFPILWMVMGMIGTWQRHARANRTLDIIKSYAEQGKEPPPELLALLRPRDSAGNKPATWTPVFVFGVLAIGLVMFAFVVNDRDPAAWAAFFLGAAIMVALGAGKLVTLLSEKKRNGNAGQ